jgi:hypothetical protein
MGSSWVVVATEVRWDWAASRQWGDRESGCYVGHPTGSVEISASEGDLGSGNCTVLVLVLRKLGLGVLKL